MSDKYNPCDGCPLYDNDLCTGEFAYGVQAIANRLTCNEHLINEFPKIYKQLVYKIKELNVIYQKNKNLEEKLSVANLEIENLKRELDKAYEWEQTNRATGICETCTEKANLMLDNYRKGVNEIKKLIDKIKEVNNE